MAAKARPTAMAAMTADSLMNRGGVLKRRAFMLDLKSRFLKITDSDFRNRFNHMNRRSLMASRLTLSVTYLTVGSYLSPSSRVMRPDAMSHILEISGPMNLKVARSFFCSDG